MSSIISFVCNFCYWFFHCCFKWRVRIFMWLLLTIIILIYLYGFVRGIRKSKFVFFYIKVVVGDGARLKVVTPWRPTVDVHWPCLICIVCFDPVSSIMSIVDNVCYWFLILCYYLLSCWSKWKCFHFLCSYFL